MRPFLPAILCAFTLAASAQPAGMTRVLRTIDFEERNLGNNEDVPMHWVKVEGPGFPHYVNGHLSPDQAHGGQFSFRFDLNGGSLVYRYDPKIINVRPGAAYRIDAWVMTSVLEHARARVTGYFTDIDGHPILSSVRHSELYAAKVPDEAWKRLRFDLTAMAPESAHLVLELELVQPQIYAESSLGGHTLYPQDIHGTAWFDDVTVSQIPRVNLTTGRPGNLFMPGEAISLSMEVHDAFTEDLAVRMVVRDAGDQLVYQRSGTADFIAGDGDGSKRTVIPLPDLPPGWYQVSMEMSSQGQSLGGRTLNFVRLSREPAAAQPDERFGLIATDLPFDIWADLPRVLPALGVGRVKLGVWTRSGDAEHIDAAAFDAVLSKLRELQIRPTGCLIDLPPVVMRKLDERQGGAGAESKTPGASWSRLLKAKPEDWQAPLDDLIARHSTHLDRWQLGPDGSDVFVARPGMREAYGKVYDEFASLQRQPDLAMPWPAWYELDGKLPATVALVVPTSVLPPQIPMYMQDLRGKEGHHLSLSLQLLERDSYGRDEQIRDLAQRVVYALSAGAERIDLPCPFIVVPPAEGTEGDVTQQPQDLFPVMRTLLTSLGQAKYVGRVPITDGVEAFLFDRGGEGVLVLWDNGHTKQLQELAINLGGSPRMTDLGGNDVPMVRPVADAARGTVQLAIGPSPVFITNIDGPLIQLRSSVAIDRPLIESTTAAHSRTIRFMNTYPVHLAGSLKLTAPSGWTITPSLIDFSLNPGESFEREIAIEFPLSSTAGARTIGADFTLTNDRTTHFRMPLAVKLGLSDVGMQTLAIRDGRDVIIQQIIHNYSDKPIDYTAFATLPGQARQERLVTDLGPGQSTVKRYRFNNLAGGKGLKARVGVKELDGARLLNDEVEVP